MSSVVDILRTIDVSTLNGINIDNREFARKIINYPAMMVPAVQETIIKTLISDMPQSVSIIDPFMGASNTLVTGMKYGANVYGQDINPLSVLISQVKTSVYNVPHLKNSFISIQEKIKNDKKNVIEVQFRNIDKWFTKTVQIELSKIHRAIITEKNRRFRKFFWVALAEVVRLTSNDRTSTFKMHIRTKEDIANRNLSPITIFSKTCDNNINDIDHLINTLQARGLIKKNKYINRSDVKWGDSKKKIRTNKRYNLLVTSPPYGDNHTTVTYGQFSYLPLQWIPLEDIDKDIDMDYLSVIQEIDRSSLGGKLMEEYKNIEEQCFESSQSLKKFFEGFSLEEHKKAKKVVSFINDLSITIDKVMMKMDKGSYMAWTVGNRTVNGREVQNDMIIIELMEHKGISLLTDLERDILSKRMPRKNNYSKTMIKEKILIFKTE